VEIFCTRQRLIAQISYTAYAWRLCRDKVVPAPTPTILLISRRDCVYQLSVCPSQSDYVYDVSAWSLLVAPSCCECPNLPRLLISRRDWRAAYVHNPVGVKPPAGDDGAVVCTMPVSLNALVLLMAEHMRINYGTVRTQLECTRNTAARIARVGVQGGYCVSGLDCLQRVCPGWRFVGSIIVSILNLIETKENRVFSSSRVQVTNGSNRLASVSHIFTDALPRIKRVKHHRV